MSTGHSAEAKPFGLRPESGLGAAVASDGAITAAEDSSAGPAGPAGWGLSACGWGPVQGVGAVALLSLLTNNITAE